MNMTVNKMLDLIDDVFGEVELQDRKWGIQNHPSVDLVLAPRNDPNRMCEEYEIPTESRAKQLTDIHAKRGDLTWGHIAVEELSEVISCVDEQTRRAELVQLAAVVLNWIDCIDRNKA